MNITKTQPKSYVEIFFSLVEKVNDQTGERSYKLPLETIKKLEPLCRLELGKAEDGKDLPVKRPSLAERIKEAEGDVSFYRNQLKDTNRWTLNDLAFFEYRLVETKKTLSKLKKR